VETRPVGESGLEVPRLILGCGNFGGVGSAPEFFGQGESEEEAFRIMDAAWHVGITMFDTADAYGGGRSETFIGNWIRDRGHRPKITTKTYNPMGPGEDHGLARERIARQLESSLSRLELTRVELYLAHEFDPETPVEETIATFEGLVELGLIKTYGFSNVDADQLRSVVRAGGKPAVVQNSYSLLDRGDERELLQACADFEIAYIPFGPLAGGWLAGKYKRGEEPPPGSRMTLRPEPYEHLQTEKTFDRLDRFAELAERRGVDTAALAIAWLLAQPMVTAVVIGPRSPKQLEPALRALELRLSREEAAGISALFA
jgi:aryl-alcohol dehydrogenase-like predicted oxidoreductase